MSEVDFEYSLRRSQLSHDMACLSYTHNDVKVMHAQSVNSFRTLKSNGNDVEIKIKKFESKLQKSGEKKSADLNFHNTKLKPRIAFNTNHKPIGDTTAPTTK